MYKKPDLSPKERARDLLSKMTLDEKIEQMAFFYSLKNLANDVKSGADLLCQCGVFGNLSHLADENAFDQIQEYFVNRTRFGIPLLMTFESLHGLYHSKATVFPASVSLPNPLVSPVFRCERASARWPLWALWKSGMARATSLPSFHLTFWAAFFTPTPFSITHLPPICLKHDL